MYNGYSELTALPPEAYLNWREFGGQGGSAEYADKQYEKGLKVGRDNDYIFISANGTWGAMRDRPRDHSMITSYEGIGYHGCTDALLHGFLDSGAPIVVYRYDDLKGTWIKGSNPFEGE